MSEEVDKMPDDAVPEVQPKRLLTSIDTGPIIEPKFVKECKLCNLSKTNVTFYDWITKHAMEGMSFSKLKKISDQYVAENGLRYQVPVRKSIARHFQKHMPIVEMSVMHSARTQFVPTAGVPLHKSTVFDNFKLEDFDEYEELCKLFTKFKEVTQKIYEFDVSLQVTHVNGGEVWSQTKIQTWLSMMNTQKSILSEIAKMRQGDKLISLAARYVIKTFTENILSKLQHDFQAFTAIMKRQGVDTEVVSAFDRLTTEAMAQHFIEEAEATMGRTNKQFKLPTNVH